MDQVGCFSVRPDWAFYWTLGNFLKPLASITLPKSVTFLGNFCKGVKIYDFSSEIIFGQLLQTFAIFSGHAESIEQLIGCLSLVTNGFYVFSRQIIFCTQKQTMLQSLYALSLTNSVVLCKYCLAYVIESFYTLFFNKMPVFNVYNSLFKTCV